MKRATTMKLVTAAVWLAVCAAVLQADAWERLAGLIGVVALLLATVALGLVLRWWAVLVAPMGFVLAAVVVRPGDETYDTFWLVFVLVPVSAVVAAIASVVARWVNRPQPASVLVAVAAGLVVCGLVLDARTVDHHPQSPVMVNPDTGALPDVRPGPTPQGYERRSASRSSHATCRTWPRSGTTARTCRAPGSLQGDFESAGSIASPSSSAGTRSSATSRPIVTSSWARASASGTHREFMRRTGVRQRQDRRRRRAERHRAARSGAAPSRRIR